MKTIKEEFEFVQKNLNLLKYNMQIDFLVRSIKNARF